MSFYLEKYYMDVVGPFGPALICYSARLHWFFLRIPFSQRVFVGEGSRSETSLFREAIFPYWKDGVFRLTHDSYELMWKPLSEGREFLLYESPTGYIRWNVLMPSARFRAAGEEITHGLGYAERLEMTIPPWSLPIAELRWGRFVSDEYYLVWIEWRGEHPKTLVLYNGEEFGDAEISEEYISIPAKGLRLKISGQHIIRDGRLINTAFDRLGLLKLVFPKKIMHSHEWKARSYGELFSREERLAGGWVIHEVVKFGGGRE